MGAVNRQGVHHFIAETSRGEHQVRKGNKIVSRHATEEQARTALREITAPRSPAVWEGRRDFGLGEKLYRCLDVSSRLGTSVFEYWNDRLQCWRRVANYDARKAFHSFITENVRDPF